MCVRHLIVSLREGLVAISATPWAPPLTPGSYRVRDYGVPYSCHGAAIIIVISVIIVIITIIIIVVIIIVSTAASLYKRRSSDPSMLSSAFAKPVVMVVLSVLSVLIKLDIEG